MEEVCIECGGYGFADRPCPECGRSSVKTLDETTIKNVDKFVSGCDFRLIPIDYVGMEWDPRKLKEFVDDKSVYFQRYIKNGEKLVSRFAEGIVPSSSMIIVTPPKYGKNILAYYCMQLAMNSGFSVAPMLDTVEVKRLLVLGAQDIKYRLYGKYSYDKYISSDVLFLTVSKTAYHSEALDVIAEVMDRRSRLGLPTFVISRFRLKECENGSVKSQSFIDNTGCSNLKYPVIIEVI